MEYSEELRWLAAKAYPDLSTKAHEQLALTHFQNSISDTQAVLLVKQKNPSSLAEAVTYVMQIECTGLLVLYHLTRSLLVFLYYLPPVRLSF